MKHNNKRGEGVYTMLRIYLMIAKREEVWCENGWKWLTGWLNWTRETEHLVGCREIFWANWPKCIRGLTKKKRNGREKVNTALETQQTGTTEQAPGEGSILEDSTDNDAAWKHAEDKSLSENLRTITLLHKQGDNGDLRKHSIYRQLVCCLQSFCQSKWG